MEKKMRNFLIDCVRLVMIVIFKIENYKKIKFQVNYINKYRSKSFKQIISKL